MRSFTAILMMVAGYALAVVPPPSETPAEVLVSGRTSTLKSIKIVKVGQEIPKTYAGSRIANTPGYSWYVSQHYAMKSSMPEDFCREMLTMAELEYPHIVRIIGREPNDIEHTRMAFVYGKNMDDLQKAVQTDLGTFWAQSGAGGVTLPANRTAYNYPSGGLKYHKRDLVIHENLHMLQMCVSSTDKTNVRFAEGITYSFANHVYDEDKQQLTINVIDKATINNPYDTGLKKLKERFVTAQDFYGGSGYDYLPEIYMLWTQFMYTDPERCMKLWLWRDAMFESELKGDARKQYDIEVMKRLYGPASDMDIKWREWLSHRKNSFHYVDWGWEQSGDTLWSYGWPGWARFAQTNIRLPLNEKPGIRKWVMDYPPTAKPTPLVGPVKRGVAEPSVGVLIDFSRSHTGKAGLGLGVHGKGEKRDFQKFLAVLIESIDDFRDVRIVFEGGSVALPDRHAGLPADFIAAAKADGYRIGMTVKVTRNKLEIVLRAGSGSKPIEYRDSLSLNAQQRDEIVSMPWAVLSLNGRHGLTLYPDVIREKVDLSVPAPLGRYRFAGEKQLYGLYRAWWRLGEKSPKSLLALKKKMTAAMDKDRDTQQQAVALYQKYIDKVAHDIFQKADRDTAELALADMLGFTLSLDLDRDSTSANPAVAAYLRSNLSEPLRAAVRMVQPEASSPQKLTVSKGHASYTKMQINPRPAPYAPFLLEGEAIARWHGLTARCRSHVAGNPTIPVWWVAAPFDNRGNDRSDFSPLVKNVDITKTVRGKDGKELHWRKIERKADSAVDSEVVPDFAEMYGALENVSAYAVAFFNSPSERDAILRIGSDDGVVVWLNGQRVHTNMVARGYDSGQDQAPIHLRKGHNTLLVETTQSWGGWKMGAHILDEQGLPFDDIKF